MELLAALKARGYRWTTPTPETQRRVLDRPDRRVAADLVDIFGWSLPFAPDVLEAELLALMQGGGIVVPRGNLLASTLRVSSLDDRLFFHSAYPTTAEDAVFFGPDTYRFARFLAQTARPAHRLVDIGCGSGAGALVAARASGAREIVMADVNPAALRLARINATAAGVAACAALSDVLKEVEGSFDLAIANPPYLVDDERRVYRHGGEMLGAGLSLESRARRENGPIPADGCCSTPRARSCAASMPLPPGSCRCCRRTIAPSTMKRSIPTSSARNWSGRPIGMSTASPWSASWPKRKACHERPRPRPSAPPILEPGDPTSLHLALARFGRERLAPATPKAGWRESFREQAHLRLVERGFVEGEREAVQHLMSDLPSHPRRFMEWYERLKPRGPGQGDRLFAWLADRADLPAMRWFIAQEAAGEAGFDDLVALTQVKLPTTGQARAGAQLLGRDGARQSARHARADARGAGRGPRPRPAAAHHRVAVAGAGKPDDGAGTRPRLCLSFGGSAGRHRDDRARSGPRRGAGPRPARCRQSEPPLFRAARRARSQALRRLEPPRRSCRWSSATRL